MSVKTKPRFRKMDNFEVRPKILNILEELPENQRTEKKVKAIFNRMKIVPPTPVTINKAIDIFNQTQQIVSRTPPLKTTRQEKNGTIATTDLFAKAEILAVKDLAKCIGYDKMKEIIEAIS